MLSPCLSEQKSFPESQHEPWHNIPQKAWHSCDVWWSWVDVWVPYIYCHERKPLCPAIRHICHICWKSVLKAKWKLWFSKRFQTFFEIWPDVRDPVQRPMKCNFTGDSYILQVLTILFVCSKNVHIQVKAHLQSVLDHCTYPEPLARKINFVGNFNWNESFRKLNPPFVPPLPFAPPGGL